MQYLVLGPLEIRGWRGEPLGFSTGKPRLLLAMLLLEANTVVADSRLIDGLWPATPPRSALPNLRTYAGRVRRLVRPATDHAGPRLVTEPGGYRMVVTPEHLDLLRWQALVADGLSARHRGDPAAAEAVLSRAQQLWRGTPCAGLPLTGWVQARVASLQEQHLDALETLADARLTLGAHNAVVRQLRGLVAEHGLRERFWAQLMLALYRSGRQAEALGAYHEVRARLADELGVEPGTELRRLQHSILTGDPSLDHHPRA